MVGSFDSSHIWSMQTPGPQHSESSEQDSQRALHSSKGPFGSHHLSHGPSQFVWLSEHHPATVAEHDLKSIVQHADGLGVATGDEVGVDTGDKVGYPVYGVFGFAVTGATGEGVVGSPLLGTIVISAQFQNFNINKQSVMRYFLVIE